MALVISLQYLTQVYLELQPSEAPKLKDGSCPTLDELNDPEVIPPELLTRPRCGVSIGADWSPRI